MKRSVKEVVLLFTAACVPLTIPGAESDNAANLHYNFAPNTTNVYHLEIENQGEAGREMIAGNYIITTKRTYGNLVALTFHGQLMQKPIPGQMMMPYRGPGYPASLSSYSMRPRFDGMELVVDNTGRVIRQSGDTPLPMPLGQIMTSLIGELPNAFTTNEWTSERQVNIADDPLGQGPAATFPDLSSGGFNYGYYPGRSGLGILSSTVRTTMHTTATNEDLITLHRTLSLNSWMMTGNEPRVSATGGGDIVFDQKLGLPKTVELQCKTSVTTENVSRRSNVSLRWRLLEGSEREAVLNPPTEPSQNTEMEMTEEGVVRPLRHGSISSRGKTELSPEEIGKLIDKLKSGESYERQNAARTLSMGNITTPSPELMSFMSTLVNDPDDAVQSCAATFLANHGTQENVPILIKCLASTTDQNVRTSIIRGLGRLKDKRAVQPLAEVLAMGSADQLQFNSSRNTDAADALERIGPEAEPAVLSLLKEKNNATRWQACQVLKHIGTSKSIPMLKDLMLVPSRELSEAAADACRAIEAREGK